MGIFASSPKFTPATSIPSQLNKVILVTGGNTGLGKETILQLALHSPAKIYMGARSAERATEAIASIRAQLPKDNNVDISHLPLDLSSLASIQAAAERVTSTTQRLDIVILNAGVMALPAGTTKEGFDNQMGTNHLGHFYLVQRLSPLLTSTASRHNDVRIVALTSEAHQMPFPAAGLTSTDLQTNPQKMSPWARYSASKAANIVFAAELARRYPQFTTASVHPGIIMTDLHKPGQDSYSIMGWLLKLMHPFVGSDVPQGACNSLWAATAKKAGDAEKAGSGWEAGVVSGSYYTPVGGRHAGKWYAENEEVGKKLWSWSEEEIKRVGF